MRKISCLVTSWVVLLLVVFSSVSNVEAITIDNDGNARENPYGDSKLPSSYTSGDYYDCYLPYNLTPADIGGYSDSVIASVNDTYNYSMVSRYPDRINSKFTSSVNIYKLVSSIGSSYQGCSVSTEADTGAGIVTDANGGKYYMTAIQKFFYNFPGVEMEGSTFPGWSMANRGQVFDVILTDGTCIHFCVGDANDTAHTNGGPVEEELWNVQYTFTELKLKQYLNIFHAAYGNTIELTGDTASGKKLASKYKLSQSENQIAYYRMYNFTIANAPARADGVGNEPSYSMGNATILNSGEDGGSGVASSISKLVTEWELQGMPSKSEIKQRQKQISLPSRDDLTIDEAYSVALIGSGLSVNSQASAFDTARIIMVFIGLVVVSYAVLLFVAMIFDRVNVFIDISLVSILTFGKLKYSPYEEDSINKKGFVTTKKLVIQLIVVLLVGIFILSSCVFTILGDVVYWISSKL